MWYPGRSVRYALKEVTIVDSQARPLLVLAGIIQKPGKEWNLLLVLGLMELASMAPEYSLFGMIEQYEPVEVLLAYLVIARYAYEYIRGEGSLKPILGVLTVSVGALCVLGLTQVFQHDFWETELGKSILIPQAYAELRKNLRFQFSNAGSSST